VVRWRCGERRQRRRKSALGTLIGFLTLAAIGYAIFH
jgi:hypothetical protein